MTTISVPVTPEQERFIKSKIKSRFAANKAEVVRKAIDLLAEEEAIVDVLRAEQEVLRGKAFSGDLRKLVRKFK